MTFICRIFRNNKILPKYLTGRKLKISAVFIFEIKVVKKEKKINFLKDSFYVMRSPMVMNFGVFLETYVRLLTSLTSLFFSSYSKSYDNLNAKSCLKLNVLNKKTRCLGATKLYVPNTTFQFFVVFKILLNFVSMQNFLNANNC